MLFAACRAHKGAPLRRRSSTRPGDRVGIDRTAEEEEARSAGGERYEDGHEDALAGREVAAGGAEADTPRHIGKGEPVQNALVA